MRAAAAPLGDPGPEPNAQNYLRALCAHGAMTWNGMNVNEGWVGGEQITRAPRGMGCAIGGSEARLLADLET